MPRKTKPSPGTIEERVWSLISDGWEFSAKQVASQLKDINSSSIRAVVSGMKIAGLLETTKPRMGMESERFQVKRKYQHTSWVSIWNEYLDKLKNGKKSKISIHPKLLPPKLSAPMTHQTNAHRIWNFIKNRQRATNSMIAGVLEMNPKSVSSIMSMMKFSRLVNVIEMDGVIQIFRVADEHKDKPWSDVSKIFMRKTANYRRLHPKRKTKRKKKSKKKVFRKPGELERPFIRGTPKPFKPRDYIEEKLLQSFIQSILDTPKRMPGILIRRIFDRAMKECRL